MNTSTNTNHDTMTGFRRYIAGALLAIAFTMTGIGLAATAYADDAAPAPSTDAPAAASAPATNCKTELWGLLGSQRRTLCDGPISKDGSWSRERTIWVPAHYSTPICTSRGSGSFSSFSSCFGGYFVDQHEISRESYSVRPDTVLPDEPGHLD